MDPAQRKSLANLLEEVHAPESEVKEPEPSTEKTCFGCNISGHELKTELLTVFSNNRRDYCTFCIRKACFGCDSNIYTLEPAILDGKYGHYCKFCILGALNEES